MENQGNQGLTPPMREHRRTRYGPATVLAVVVAMVALWLAPTRWLLEHRAPSAEDFDSRARALADRFDQSVRIIPTLSPPGPAPHEAEPVVVQIEIPVDAPVEIKTDVEGTGSAREKWSYDPLTAHAFGRDALLAPADRPTAILLSGLNAKGLSAEAMGAFAGADTSLVARARENFTTVAASLFRREIPDYCEQQRQRRLDKYWDRYIVGDGSQ